jgi:hypothetical protein
MHPHIATIHSAGAVTDRQLNGAASVAPSVAGQQPEVTAPTPNA